MIGRFTRFLVLRFWLDAALVAAVLLVLAAGTEYALLRPTEPAGADALAAGAARILQLLPVPACVVAALLGAARLHTQRGFVALASAGRSTHFVARAFLLAALPLALIAFVLDAFPLRAGAVPLRAAEWGAPLAGGGFLFRARDAREGAVLVPRERRLAFGTLRDATSPATDAIGPGTSDPGAVTLDVREVWHLSRDAPRIEAVASGADPWRGRALLTPRSLVWGPAAGPLRLTTLAAWLRDEPQRADLRFARDARLAAPLRVLAALLLCLAPCVRATLDPFLPRALRAALFVGAYLSLELFCASLGVAGRLHPGAAALGPALACGLVGWLSFRQSAASA